VLYLRSFIDAVIEYTQAKEVDVIAHSLGVTFARRVMKGGEVNAYARKTVGTEHDRYWIGEPLTNVVHTFIAIAGGNWGMPACFLKDYEDFKICNNATGLYPGI